MGQSVGVLDERQAQSVIRAGGAVARSFEDITPEQEYYIGRTVGAVILSKYTPYQNDEANRYVNMVGTLAGLASDRPETFGGYHFLILDSEEINAFAAPGGLIFVTRGMLRCCGSEDAVAAVLAHEVGHVQHQHGLQAIKKSRVTSALTILAAEGAKTLGGQELAQLTEVFEESVSDVVSTLVANGYSRASEREADRAAVTVLARLGYDSAALVDMLEIMGARLTPGGSDFAKTHPSPQSRIADIRPLLPKTRPAAVAPRQRRFEQVLRQV
ncbi:MAG TPA: peptidase M48 [Desulfonatronum sp.]|nr:peptidase M48 [Desulfonatronum sp.]